MITFVSSLRCFVVSELGGVLNRFECIELRVAVLSRLRVARIVRWHNILEVRSNKRAEKFKVSKLPAGSRLSSFKLLNYLLFQKKGKRKNIDFDNQLNLN